MDATHEQADRMNAPRAKALCQCFNGALEFQVGNWDTAETSLLEAVEIYGELDAASGEALSWQRLGVLQTAQGEYERGLASLQEGVAVAERATMRAHCLARLYASMTENRLQAGDLEAADEYLERGLTMGERHGNCSTCDALLLPVAVSLRLAQDRVTEAGEFAEELRQAAEEYASRVWRAMSNRAQGELKIACGEPEAAIGSLERAQELYEHTGNTYEAARSQVLLAEARRLRDQPGDEQQAAEELSSAQESLERLGASAPVP
ncbi:MAG: hypothetical protein R3191_03080 [Anaerolineales bacterium]|nr:hypothetical protein [Anaerolineales bacterium]